MNSAKKIGERAGFFFSPLLVSKTKIGVIAAIVGAGVLIASARSPRAEVANAEAVKKCASPITACGCTITKSGFYTLANDLSSSQGMTAKNGCIDIKASKVILNTAKPNTGGTTHGGFDIEGPGGTTPTGIGIHILKGSNKDLVELPSFLEGWDVAILVEGNSNIIEDFDAADSFDVSAIPNGTAGVEINGGSNNNINDFTVGKNKNYGIWLRGASNNQINCSNTNKNGNIGVYVGCSPNGPINAQCSPAVPPSNNNRIFDHSAGNNTNFGVVIDLGNTGNIVTDLSAFGNGTKDLLDENSNCGNNLWFFNGFGTASPGCID